MPRPSYALVRDLFDYSDEAKGLVWKAKTSPLSRVVIGQNAGCPGKEGYIVIGIRKRTFFAHHLVWLWCHGEWPQRQLDHANCDPADNRIANLRLASSSENTANQKRKSTNTSGFKGVGWHRGLQRWQAVIMQNYKSTHLGYFDTPEAAHEAYVAAASVRFGEFARAT